MKIPDYEHYAIITFDQQTIPGDQRSKESPGHGYPEHTIESMEYEPHRSIDTLKERIKYLMSGNKKYKVLKVKPVNVTAKVLIDLESDK
jgi:hypothetical protein